MKQQLVNVGKSLLGTVVTLAVVGAIALAALGGHADHAVTDDRAGPVERKALAERQAIVVSAGPQQETVVRFRAQEPGAAWPGGVDPNEE
jgi:hypothetical protein